MKTRTIREDEPSEEITKVENGDFDFNNLPKPKPIGDLASAAAALRAPVDTRPANTVEIVSSEKNAVNLRPNTSNTLGPQWVRQDMPSLSIPYKNKEIFLKTLDIPELGKIWSAKENSSFTMLVDALDSCISVDARSLTPEDFTFVMYWIRDNSLPRSPMNVSYTTKYGNEIEVSTRHTSMTITELDMSEAEYAEWRAKGIVFPTIRDAELISNNQELSDDVRWMLEYAQYVEYIPTPGVTDYSDYVDRKIERLQELKVAYGLEILTEIDKFSGLIKHGVVERVKIKDNKFDPVKAIQFWRSEALKRANIVRDIPEELVRASSQAILMLGEEARELLQMAKDMQAKLDAGETVVPDEEVVAVQITATDFFPRV